MISDKRVPDYSRSRRNSGFTLLELLVAVTVLGVILLLAFNGLRFGARSWETERTQAERTAAARAVQDYLRQQLALAVPIRIVTATDDRLLFSGTQRRLSFVAPMSRGQRGAGRYLFSLQSSHEENGERLLLEYAQLDPAMPTRTLESSSVVLLEQLTALTFDYFGSARAGLAARWSDRWPADATRLPQLVRVRFEATAPEQRVELMVPLRLRNAMSWRPT